MVAPLHSVNDMLYTAFGSALAALLAFLPRLVAACVILLVGFLAGRIVGRIVTRALRLVRFDQVAERAEMRALLRSAGVRVDPAVAVGALASWFVYLIVLQATAGVLGFPQITQVLAQIAGFLPRIAVAIAILLLGALAANLVARAVRGAEGAARFADRDVLASVARWGIIALTSVAALSQIEVAPVIVDSLWIACIGGAALALALAFGLGSRDALGSLAAGRLIRVDLQPGLRLDLDGQEATIERIGAIFTIVSAGDRRICVPNAELARRSLARLETRLVPARQGQPEASASRAGDRRSEPARAQR